MSPTRQSDGLVFARSDDATPLRMVFDKCGGEYLVVATAGLGTKLHLARAVERGKPAASGLMIEARTEPLSELRLSYPGIEGYSKADLEARRWSLWTNCGREWWSMVTPEMQRLFDFAEGDDAVCRSCLKAAPALIADLEPLGIDVEAEGTGELAVIIPFPLDRVRS